MVDKYAAYKGGEYEDNTFGYIRMMLYNHPLFPGLKHVNKHRLIMAEHLGRVLLKSETVHHLNHNKHDNRLRNLKIMTRGEHANHHHAGKIVSIETRLRQRAWWASIGEEERRRRANIARKGRWG